jgi:hypothetical protein
VRAGVAQGEGPALLVAADDERLFQKHRGQQFSALTLSLGSARYQKPNSIKGIGRLGLKWEIVGHGNR